MSQSFSMKSHFMLESALSGITHYVRSIPITPSVGELTKQEEADEKVNNKKP